MPETLNEPAEKTQIQAYVIMPFSKTTDTRTVDYWDEHFEHFIKARIKEVTDSDALLSGEFAWTIKRSSVIEGGPLNYEIIWDLLNANIVIADLTDLNSNVLYELGIRHALTSAKESGRTIMIQDETAFKLPFDFANYAVLKYGKSKVDTWKKDLKDRLISCIQNTEYRDNPVSMAFAQQNFSLRRRKNQDRTVAKMKAAFDAIERLIGLGFKTEWIQGLMEQMVLGNSKSAAK